MSLQLNLSSKPFGHERQFWVLSAAAVAVLLLIGAWLLTDFYRKNRLPGDLVVAETQRTAELQQLIAREASLRSQLNNPDTVDVYDRSYFLNQLLTRKGVSWTKTFADLEVVLPPRVLMMQIRPEVTFDNKVQLEMRVGAETPKDFIEFVIALEQSEMFGPPDVRGYSPPNDNEPYYRYDLTVRYDQAL